ncbi:phosphate/phosphite/phosphonate ABC transporter substrate-binding protein [Sphingomonas immobilis]|uniref:PhnD/SsuA/transferrin family substrate-binding protein n=1 Tax=Sphingomonas immobilis TaxID=3063997 RepID=A0ABT8ZXM1_9SPHN|nr:PhnD/SsuA/transferrin family substrate-binding protein [Sphingomonas sp. CA1-15]MDO7842043.1 PhnD/SsuA/transferrin family substrate-binding protein [Sphingomonas sp. CA1-15]
MRIASLGMYVQARQEVANDALWAALAERLRARGVADVPERLERRRAVQDVWRDPDLLFGQICGFPLVSNPALGLQVLGVPVYDAPGCEGGRHRSLIIARADDADGIVAYRGRRAAINGRDSNTGMNLFRALIAGEAGGEPFFADVRETGAHRQSISAVILGEADIAAIDAVTYAATLRGEPELVPALRIVGETAESWAPPFVTAAGTDADTVAALKAALAEVIADPALAGEREALFLRGVVPGDLERYLPLRTLESAAAAAGYLVLH